MIYHRGVKGPSVLCAVASVCVLLAGRGANAGTVPAGSVVHTGPTIDVAAFARTIAIRFDIVVRRIVTADIDRDGDLDVVAATDRGFFVWVNDGTGRLTSQTPKPTSGLDGGPGDTWNGDRSCRAESIQNDAPSTRMTPAYAHAPPAAPAADFPDFAFAFRCRVDRGAHIPRAPPARLSA